WRPVAHTITRPRLVGEQLGTLWKVRLGQLVAVDSRTGERRARTAGELVAQVEVEGKRWNGVARRLRSFPNGLARHGRSVVSLVGRSLSLAFLQARYALSACAPLSPSVTIGRNRFLSTCSRCFIASSASCCSRKSCSLRFRSYSAICRSTSSFTP